LEFSTSLGFILKDSICCKFGESWFGFLKGEGFSLGQSVYIVSGFHRTICPMNKGVHFLEAKHLVPA
jgi:hypothetical protein